MEKIRTYNFKMIFARKKEIHLQIILTFTSKDLNRSITAHSDEGCRL